MKDSRAWVEAKAAGDAAEQVVGEYFRRCGGRILRSLVMDSADLFIQIPIEVKTDLIAPRSGNIAIEVSCRGRSSGITNSDAFVWAIVVDRELFLVLTDRLREIIRRGNYREVNGGDGGFSRLKLIPIEEFRRMGGVRVVDLEDEDQPF